MKTRKILSVLSAAICLLCTVCVGFLPTAAESEWVAATLGEYQPTDTLPPDSLIAGLIPTQGTTGDAWKPYNKTQLAWLTDGELDVDGTKAAQIHLGWSGQIVETGDWCNMTFRLAKRATITHFLIGSQAAEDQYLKNVRIYVSETLDTLYDEQNRVVEATDVTAGNYLCRGAEAIGTYIGFSFLYPGPKHPWWGAIRIGELAAYGTPETRQQAMQRCVTGAAVTELTEPPAEKSLIEGKTPQNTVSVTAGNKNPTAATDGKFQGLDAPIQAILGEDGRTLNYNDAHPEYGIRTDTESSRTVYSAANGYVDIIYALGVQSTIRSFAIGSTAEDTGITKAEADKLLQDTDDGVDVSALTDYLREHTSEYVRLHKAALYVGDSPDLMQDEEPVASYEYCPTDTPAKNSGALTPLVGLYTLTVPTSGRYVGFRLYCGDTIDGNAAGKWGWYSQVRIGELAVYGSMTTKTEKKQLVCVGDSITEGTIFVSRDNNNWVTGTVTDNYPALLEQYLDDASDTIDYELYNAGIGGSAVVGEEEISQKDGAKSWMRHQRKTDKIRYADILTVMLGSNDAASYAGWAERREVYKNYYREIIAAYRSINPNLELYILTSPCTLRPPYQRTITEDIVPLQAELAAELGATLVDVYTATREAMETGGEAAFVDSIDIDKGVRLHPGEAGHKLIADTVFAVMTGQTHYTVDPMKASATSSTDLSRTYGRGDPDENGVYPGYTGSIADAGRVTKPEHNLLTREGVAIAGLQKSNEKALITNGILRFVNGDSGTDHGTGYNLSITFDTTVTISQLLLGGCMTELNETAFLYPSVKVYIGDDLSDLTAVDPVYEADPIENDGSAAGRLVTLTKPATGKRMRVILGQHASYKTAWISELAAIGYAAEESAVTVKGAQIRSVDAEGKTALRFGFDAVLPGVSCQTGHIADYTQATVRVNGKTYPVVTAGALVAIASQATPAQLVIGTQNTAVRDVPANNLYSLTDYGAMYTAVVVGIPAAHRSTAIVARPYVAYDDNGVTRYVYGDTIRRCVNDVNDTSLTRIY